jgi:hypothetical protein
VSPFDHQVVARIQQLLEAVAVPADATRPWAAVGKLEDEGRALETVHRALVPVAYRDLVPRIEHWMS